MFGIIGILGKIEVPNQVVGGLSRLEYRVYESSGVVIMSNANATVSKAVGKLLNFKVGLASKTLGDRVGIRHARWATRGAANVVNAHLNRAEQVAVVHNRFISI